MTLRLQRSTQYNKYQKSIKLESLFSALKKIFGKFKN